MRTEIYINKTLIDCNDDVSMSLNFAIADVKSPDKRNSSYSKTITIPGSKTNNKLFTWIFDISKESLVSATGSINFAPDFNPNLKADCQIYVDRLLQLNGYVQLLDIKINGDKIEYEISVFGQLGNLITEIDGVDLTDLDFSEYDHEYSKVNQKNSWDTYIIRNGSTYVNFASGAPTGEGYVYPLINYGFSQNQYAVEFNVKHLFPAIYAKTYIDKIFEKAGFTYTSDFFESEFFRRLIIPFSGEVVKLSPVDVDSRSFYVDTPGIENPSGSGSQGDGTFIANFDPPHLGGYYSRLYFTNDSTGSAYDPNNVYHIPSEGGRQLWTVNKKGYYDILVNLNATVTFSVNRVRDIKFTVLIDFWYPNVPMNGIPMYSVGTEPQTVPVSGSSINPILSFKVPNVSLNVGQVLGVRVVYEQNVDPVGFPGYAEITFNPATSFYNAPVISPLLETDTFILNSAVPRGVAAKDFFMSIVKMFNLYVNPDRDKSNNLFIEPQKDFYTGNEIIDWTDKLDISKQIDIKPVSEIEGKTYVYSYKSDKDFANQDYQDKFNKVYGERDITINNDFVKGKKEIGLIFSPSPSRGNKTFNDITIPTLYKTNEVDGNVFVSPTSGNPRILYYGGVISTDGSWTYKSITGDSVETTYPYAGNLDHPYSPTIDLLFEVPELLYYDFTGPNYTTNNLFNIYHRQFMEEITDKDSKLVTAYFRLRPIDIYQLSFKNFIHVNGINYRLNRIFDYNPLKEESTKVELSKIKRGLVFVGANTTIDTTNDSDGFGLIEGGEDEVRSLTATSPVQLIDGGQDVVIGLGSYNNINLVNGGKN